MIRVIPHRRWPRRAALCALVLPALYTVSVAPAAAATGPRPTGNFAPAEKLGNYKVTFAKYWTFKSRPLGICAVFSVKGTITYSVSLTGVGRIGLDYKYTSQHLNDSTLEADIHAYSGGSCSGPATVTGMSMGQDWTGYGCSYNPSISISVPWAVSFGFWPSCGNRNQAEHHHHYGGTYTYYVQYNSGDKASFGTYNSYVGDGQRPHPPCYGVYVSGTPYEHNKSDSYASGSQKVCLTRY